MFFTGFLNYAWFFQGYFALVYDFSILQMSQRIRQKGGSSGEADVHTRL